MHLLVLGGTVFVGRHFVEAALERGHRVTLFHRGSKGTGLIPGAEEILGDRDGQIDRIGDGPWDAVVDTCGYVPRIVRQSVEATASKTARYLFVSTISVYEEDGEGGLQMMTPATPVGTEDINGETYGPLKVECEEVVREAFGDRALIIRPGIVAGPHDPTNRFTYWVERLASGEEVLVPAFHEAPIEVIDGRDLGRFMVLALEKELSGAFDVAGEPLTFGQMIQALHPLHLGTRLVWIEEAALESHGIQIWQDLPLVAPRAALMRIGSEAALAEGLLRRPILETARDTLAWARGQTERPDKSRYGLSRDREIAVIKALRGE